MNERGHVKWRHERSVILGSLLLSATFVVLACNRRPKGEFVIVVSAVAVDGPVSLGGRMSFERNPQTGKGEPNYWKPGTLYLFRVATDKVGDVSAKPGDIFQVGPEKKMTMVGAFDLARSDDDLVERYAKK